MVNNFEDSFLYRVFVGEDCVVQFLQFVETVVKDVVLPFLKDKMNVPLAHSTVIEFHLQDKCYLCKLKTRRLVKGHCHVNGDYLGAACNKCHLSRRIRRLTNSLP